MVERAAAGLIERHGHDTIANVDILITHTQIFILRSTAEAVGWPIVLA